MDMKIANSWWMYMLGVIVVVFVLAGCIFFILRAFKDAKKKGMDQKKLKKVVINSAIFTILPSISILIGVVTLSGTLGVPLPWIRLSVIGALHYEGAAVKTALEEFGVEKITSNEIFVTIAWVMTLGILTGPLFCLFGFKAYDKKVLAKAKAAPKEEAVEEVKEDAEPTVEETPKKPKKKFGSIIFNAVFIAMVSSFLAVDATKILKVGKLGEKTEEGTIIQPMDTFIPLIVIGVTFFFMFIFDILERKCKQKWLGSFALGLSMILGMASAVLANYIYTVVAG